MERHFVDCILDGDTPVTTVEDGKRASVIALMGYGSASSGSGENDGIAPRLICLWAGFA
jgi:hypothetical protein